MRGIITENTSCNVTHDIIIEGQVAFKAGETVVVEIVSPNLQRPEYKYVVTSKSLQRKFQLSDRDLSEVLDQETPAQLRVPEREFLNIISKRSISKINADFWSNHVGVLSEEVSRLIHLGLIEVAGTREKAEAGYTQKELKLLSEERGLKV